MVGGGGGVDGGGWWGGGGGLVGGWGGGGTPDLKLASHEKGPLTQTYPRPKRSEIQERDDIRPRQDLNGLRDHVKQIGSEASTARQGSIRALVKIKRN